MNRGIVATTGENAQALESIEVSTNSGDNELRHCIEIRQNHENGVDGELAQIGRAASQVPVQREQMTIDDGEIVMSEVEDIETQYTEFIYAPGKFLITGDSDGDFMYDLIRRNFGIQAERSTINLQDYLNERPDAEVWKLGFQGRSGMTENGVLYGNGITEDDDAEKFIEDSLVNMLGLQYSSGTRNIKVDLSESGFLSLYQPANYDRLEFTQFISDEIAPHIVSV